MQKTQQLLTQAKAAGKPLSRNRTSSGRRPSDSQRSKLYSAEQVIRTGPQLSPEGVRQLVKDITTSPYVIKNYGSRTVKVTITAARTRTSAAFWQTGEIRLAAAWGRSADVVIHEVAHMYASPAGDPGHDWLFCSIYLDLVRAFIGTATARKLEASFKANGIRYTVPKAKRQLSPDQKQAAVERMAKARAARQVVSVEEHAFVMESELFGERRWVAVESLRSGRIYTTSYVGRKSVLTRNSTAGIARALLLLNGNANGHTVRAIPVSQLPVGSLRDWSPTG